MELEALERRCEQLEHALVEAQRLATLGQLASRMAHEFNNVLTSVIGRAAHALKHPDDTELLLKSCRTSAETGQRAADIVASVLGYARDRRTQSRPIRADALMDGAVNLVAWDLPKSRIQVVRQYECGASVRVIQVRIEQVLLNLLLNARKAMLPQGGCITASVRPAGTPGYVALAVQDTGRGIAPEDVDRIFEPFFSAHAPSDEPGEQAGTGLGLSVALDLVRQAGGEIHVESAPGVGSTFTVLLPAADGEA
jgi:signal transduction histidine kinase